MIPELKVIESLKLPAVATLSLQIIYVWECQRVADPTLNYKTYKERLAKECVRGGFISR